MNRAVRRQLPNALTVLRIFLAAAFFGTLNFYRYPDVHVALANFAIVLFLAAVTTDALDGYLARKWHVESLFGRLMDPFCDKVLILGAFIYMTGPRFAFERETDVEPVIYMATAVYPWMVMLILARELLVTGIRGLIVSEGVSFGSLWSGKAKMILQSLTIPIILILTVNFHPSENLWAMRLCEVLVYLTVLVTVWSGMPYIFGLQRMLAEQKQEKARES
ncbi:MAG: CDP-alcohol phosphatidyltransferase family protein [Phycisphaerales bacterium]|nr:CDP-alcohol phosphatidyltransferase family protein [Phycisphaerales bacterium]MCI0632259.1 CDP-alcohol phosphatidyltransferase family protein [Phycisphaerales bacterium]MCI0676957.1 CDP-alcohol phosphatidyltransferase family protein [Phycisphaerales bacterium]